MDFDSVLVANRGEIARRVIRTAKSMGYRTVAVYSDADENSLHVSEADSAIHIGPPPAVESYLNIERVISAAVKSRAGAVHPGYGFLSENADFAAACEAAGLVFIGPSPEAITLMGNKAAAKRKLAAAGVCGLPGYHGEDQSWQALTSAAAELGFPVMIKAAAGGGGRGMRLVSSPGNLNLAIDLARSEAKSAFGSDELILERALVRPRHVEIQVLADAHGNAIHLGERDCSVQRRHQKVIEESPCPVMTPEMREKMGSAAVTAASSINYRGVGTVEFLLDEDGQFYFMEMNTRLQVEHPVTEMITGLDLVAEQIKVARGEPLGLRQEGVRLDGHAIEVRLYAEDPSNNFMPSTGRVEALNYPSGNGIRVDAGVAAGAEISLHYDPMLAKIVAWGQDRGQALQRLRDALMETVVFGPRTNRDFLLEAIDRQSFKDGAATTRFVSEEFPGGFESCGDDPELLAVAAVVQHCSRYDKSLAKSVVVNHALRNWSSTGALVSHYRYGGQAGPVDVRVSASGLDEYRAATGSQSFQVSVTRRSDGNFVLRKSGKLMNLISYFLPDQRRVFMALGKHSGCWTDILGLAEAAEQAPSGQVVAPMHGVLQALLTESGDVVTKGDELLILEAMKMQHELRAPVSGVINAIHFKQGDQVSAGSLLLEIEEPS